MIKIIMHGCNGHMGQVISEIVKNDEFSIIAAGIDLSKGKKNDYPVFQSLSDCDIKADVVIDFASSKATDALLDYCTEKNIPVVLCTTGLSEQQLERINADSKKVAILKSANMSLGINTLLKLLQDAAKVFVPAGYDVEIIEKHHNQKIDAPSGTALALADSINEVFNNEFEYKYDRTLERKKREQKEIGMSVVRGGTIVGEHEVLFAGTDEVIEIKHTAYSRAVFGKGAVEAAKFLAGKAPRLYNMSDVIG